MGLYTKVSFMYKIKRYKNRKMWNISESRYITFKELYENYDDSMEFIEHDTNNDITVKQLLVMLIDNHENINLKDLREFINKQRLNVTT